MGRWWTGGRSSRDEGAQADPQEQASAVAAHTQDVPDAPADVEIHLAETVTDQPPATLHEVAFPKEKPSMNTSFRLPFDRSSAYGDDAAGAPTVIRAGLHLEGNIRTGDDILLEGSIRGDVVANSITVAAGATLSGTVSAAVIVVDGTIEGVVRCIKLQVNTTGSVSGEIHHSVLVVEAGAAIEGTVFRSDRSHEEQAQVVAAVPAYTPVLAAVAPVASPAFAQTEEANA